ncbi:hypothetical protein [Mycobacterium sp. E342]|uniref:hypothetical protein n=1 Tax=Mycobacterium sp. E342 TaxID=1834147 RepID=UPI000ABEA4FA|nr:hypothetical protein [Mycobacterium sp. E342]
MGNSLGLAVGSLARRPDALGSARPVRRPPEKLLDTATDARAIIDHRSPARTTPE